MLPALHQKGKIVLVENIQKYHLGGKTQIFKGPSSDYLKFEPDPFFPSTYSFSDK